MIIYKTTNLLDYKSYVGKSKYNRPNYFGSGTDFIPVLKELGKKNFRKDILEYCYSQKELNKRERFWIKLLRTQDRRYGYNIHKGGGGGIIKSHSEESKLKMSKAQLEHFKKPGSKDYLIGHILMEKSREKIKIKRLEHFKKPGSKDYLIGHEVSEETREKLRQSNLGKTYSKEINKKKGHPGELNPFYGKTHSKETKKILSLKASKKIGELNPFYGKTHSEKTKKILSLNASLQHTKRKNNIEKINIIKEKLKELNCFN